MIDRSKFTPEQNAYFDELMKLVAKALTRTRSALRHVKNAQKLPYPPGLGIQHMKTEAGILGRVAMGLQESANLLKNL